MRSKENLSDSAAKPCLMGALKLAGAEPARQRDLHFEELMYTGRVAKVFQGLVTPELHIHYMHNWNWI